MESAGTRRRGARAVLPLSLGTAALLALGPVAAGAATVSAAWSAKIGSAAINGTATIQSFTTGTGMLALKIAKMKASTALPVVLHKGTCGSGGAVFLTLPSIKTTGSGTASRTSMLTAAQVTKILAATTAGKIAIRVGTGSARKCGLFAAQAIPPYVAATVAVGDGPAGVAVAPSGVWVTNYRGFSVSRIDPVTNSVVQTINVGSQTVDGNAVEYHRPYGIVYSEGSLWATLVGFWEQLSTGPHPMRWTAGSVLRIDPATGNVQATIPVGVGPWDVDATAGAVWVSVSQGIVRIDPATNAVVATIPVRSANRVAAAADVVWVSSFYGTMSRIDPATNMVVATINVANSDIPHPIGLWEIALGPPGAVWVTQPGHTGQTDGIVSRIDPATNTVVANVVVGQDPRSLSYAGGSVWVGLYGAPTVVQIGGPGYSLVKKIAVSASVHAIAATDHSVWAVHQAADGAGKVTRINY